jgi:predicted nucleotidyltransferase
MGTIPPGRLADTLFGRTRRQVLSLLYGHPDQSFFVREVARTTGAALGAVQKELVALTEAGILDRSVRGRQVYFQANRSAPIFGELHSLIAKTAGIVDVIRSSLAPLETGIDAAFVFGSVAKGEERGTSDIDLFVIGSVSFGDVVDALAGSQRMLGRDINPVVQTRAEFAKRVTSNDHFVAAVLQTPRLHVIGGDDELEQLAGERLAAVAQDEPAGNRRPPGHRRARPEGQRGGRLKR